MSEQTVRQFVFPDDKSELSVERYVHVEEGYVSFFIPSENAWIIYQGSTPFHTLKENSQTQHIRETWSKTDGVVEGDNAFLFRLIIKAKRMEEYSFDHLQNNSTLFKVKDSDTMPRGPNKPKVKSVELHKKAGVLLRTKQLVAFLKDQPPDSEVNAEQVAAYLNGIYDEVDPAPVIQCTVKASTTSS